MTGTMVNGAVVWDGGFVPPPDGTRVTVIPSKPTEAASPLAALLLEYAGTAEGLPPDMAAQHDHYLHGTPKR